MTCLNISLMIEPGQSPELKWPKVEETEDANADTKEEQATIIEEEEDALLG